MDCIKTIKSEVGHSIQLSFIYFDLERSATCRFDYVTVYDGPDDKDDSRLIGKFCGHNSPGKISSSGNYLTVKFHSDGFSSGGGFYGKYLTGTNRKIRL